MTSVLQRAILHYIGDRTNIKWHAEAGYDAETAAQCDKDIKDLVEIMKLLYPDASIVY